MPGFPGYSTPLFSLKATILDSYPFLVVFLIQFNVWNIVSFWIIHIHDVYAPSLPRISGFHFVLIINIIVYVCAMAYMGWSEEYPGGIVFLLPYMGSIIKPRLSGLCLPAEPSCQLMISGFLKWSCNQGR